MFVKVVDLGVNEMASFPGVYALRLRTSAVMSLMILCLSGRAMEAYHLARRHFPRREMRRM